MVTRREFLEQLGAASVSAASLPLLTSCGGSSKRENDGWSTGGTTDPPHPTVATPREKWFWQSPSGTSQAEVEAEVVSREDWSLSIVDAEGTSLKRLEFSDLKQFEEQGASIQYLATMQDIYALSGAGANDLGEALTSTGVFRGIPLHRIFESISVPEGTRKLHTFWGDHFSSNIPFDRIRPEASKSQPPMLAYRMNGRELGPLRGGPVLLVVPEMWFFKNIRSIDKIRLSPDPEPFGEYETELFGEAAPREAVDAPAEMALHSMILRPGPGPIEGGSEVTVAGFSVVGGARIQNVEISVDGSAFESVELPDLREAALQTPNRSIQRELREARNFGDHWPVRDVWAPWSTTLSGLSRGRHLLRVRASDSNGRVQPETSERIWQTYPVAPQARREFRVT